MTVGPDIPRRVAQARHDIDDLYDLHASTNVRLVRLEGSLVRLEETQQAQGVSLVRLEESLVRLEQTQQAQGEQLAEVLDILRAGRG